MASDEKKIKAGPALKSETAAKTESPSSGDVSKAEGGDTSAKSPSSYSRGEGQKPVSQAYKDNWNAIYGKKTKR